MGELDEAGGPLRGEHAADRGGGGPFVEVDPGVWLAPDAPAGFWQSLSEGVTSSTAPPAPGLGVPAGTAAAVPAGGQRSRARGGGSRGRRLLAPALVVVLLVALAIVVVASRASAPVAVARGPLLAAPGVGMGTEPVSGAAARPVPAPRVDRLPGASPDPSASSPVPIAGRPGSTPGAGAAEHPDWWTILGELDARRARALASADPSLVDDYAAAGSAAARADAELLATLTAEGVSPSGWATSLVAIEAVQPLADAPADGPRGVGAGAPTAGGEAPVMRGMRPPAPATDGDAAPAPDGDVVIAADVAQVRLVVVDRRSAYTLVDAAGRTVGTVAASGERRWAVTLQRLGEEPGVTDPGWRVATVTRLP